MELDHFTEEWNKSGDTVIEFGKQNFSSRAHVADPLGIILSELPLEQTGSRVSVDTPLGNFSIKGRQRSLDMGHGAGPELGYAFIYVEFLDQQESSWEKLNQKSPDGFDWFDCGYGDLCFMDDALWSAWVEKGLSYEEPYDEWIAEIIDYDEDVNIVDTPNNTKLNVVSTPGGNGMYSVFLGRTEDDTPTRLVVEMLP